MIRRLATSFLTFIVLVSAVNIVCLAESQTLLTRHTREEVRTGKVPMVGHLPANQSMHLTLVLAHRNQGELDQFLKDVTDRSNPAYRQFLTVEQFTEKFGPSREDYETVKAFARQNGLHVDSVSRNRMTVQVSGSVRNVENALHVNMSIYQHPTENRTFFAPDREPSLDLPFQLWAIAGLDTYSTPHRMLMHRDPNAGADGVHSNATTGSCPSASFCGSDMRPAYYGGTALDGTGQSVGLFEFLGTDLVDLTTYYTNVGQTNNVPITLTSVDTQSTLCKESSCDDTEQTLDMTQALGMAPNMAGLTMWIGTGGLSGQTLDDPGILNGMVTASPLQAQLSCSWGWRPADETTDDPFFQEMGAQGQNFFVASGDSGKWAKGGYPFPSEDDYVTVVGGTDLETASAGGPWSSETGWADSGGGTSVDDFAIPSWQVAAAAGCALCSQSFRNGPDVSANANYTFYVCADQTSCTANEYGGTSFAAPMWAGFLALVNQQAVGNGQPVLGFINPALYDAYASSGYNSDFHDITSGGNKDKATVGYDLSTGIGSPQAALIDVLAPVSAGSFNLSATPGTITFAPGGNGRAKISSSVSGGFNSTIALSASGAPANVKVTFHPASISGAGSAAVRIQSSPKAAPGTYTITITGTGGGVTQTTTITLVIS